MATTPKYKKRLLSAYFLVLFLSFITNFSIQNYSIFFSSSIISTPSIIVNIKKNSTSKKIAQQLYEEKVIASPFLFSTYIFLKEWGKHLKYGKYEFFQGETIIDIAEKLYRGDIKNHRLTIIEGWKFSDLRKKIAETKYIKHTIQKQTNQEIATIIGIPKEFLDGAFFPDTYHYMDGELDTNLLLQAYTKMKKVYQNEFKNRKQLKHSAFTSWTGTVQDQYKVLSLAAIIEKESFIEREYGIISSVFHNRLRKNMLLQADPTVIYAVGNKYQGKIKKKHLRFKSPYNTYTTKGLPPFPIAFSGEKAIRAALNPQKTDYIYFVAKGNGREHHFNSTLLEHNKDVDAYWLRVEAQRRLNKQSK
jgi:UPF0755 protein